MILRAAIVLFLAAPLVAAEEPWQRSLTPLVPGPFPPPKTVRVAYGFGWEGIRAASADLLFSNDPAADLLTLDGKVSTEGLVRKLWKLDATQRSRVRASTLRTLDTKQFERYGSESIATDLEFRPDRVIERRTRRADGEERKRKRTTKLPDMLDMHGGLLFLRSLPLRDGDRASVVVYPNSSPYLARIVVEGRERIAVKGGTFDAIKARVELWKIGKDRSLEPHTKFKRATAWMSDDDRRLLLKVEASVFVGSVWAELESVKSSE